MKGPGGVLQLIYLAVIELTSRYPQLMTAVRRGWTLFTFVCVTTRVRMPALTMFP